MTGTDDPTGSGTAAGNDERASTPLLSPTGGGITGATRQSAHTARALPFSGPDQHLQAADHIGDLGSIQAPTPVNPRHNLHTVINTTVFADSTTAVSRVARTAGGGASGDILPVAQTAPLGAHGISRIVPNPSPVQDRRETTATLTPFRKMLERGSNRIGAGIKQ